MIEWLLWYVIYDLIGIFGWNFIFADSDRLKIESVMIFVLIFSWEFIVQNSHLYPNLNIMEDGNVERSRKELGKKKGDRKEKRGLTKGGRKRENEVKEQKIEEKGKKRDGNVKRERRKKERRWKRERGRNRRKKKEEEKKRRGNWPTGQFIFLTTSDTEQYLIFIYLGIRRKIWRKEMKEERKKLHVRPAASAV
jgi:hypothetical protein